MFVAVYRTWWRAWDSGWVPGAHLLMRVDDGAEVVPAQLSWGTADGAQSVLGFAPDLSSCHGHRRTADGDVVEVRGELDSGWAGSNARAYEFAAEVEHTEGWWPVGPLRLAIDDGGEAPLQWASWGDRSGDTCLVALRSARASGNADVTDLVTTVWASAEYPEAGEVAANLVDRSDTKWFAPDDHAALHFELTHPVAADRYVLTSANDAPDRDPAAWSLFGSADGHRFQVLDARFDQTFTDRHQSRTYRIPEPGLYSHYRLVITATSGSPDLQLEAVRFLADSSAFTGYRHRTGHAPVPYRGIRVMPDAPGAAPVSDDHGGPVTLAALETLFNAESTPIVRTDFSDDDAWEIAWRDITAQREYWDEDVVLDATLVALPEFAGWTGEELAALLLRCGTAERVLVVDAVTLASPEHSVLVVEIEPEQDRPRSFRATPRVLVDLEIQLSAANMDWEYFSESVDPDGVVRTSSAD